MVVSVIIVGMVVSMLNQISGAPFESQIQGLQAEKESLAQQRDAAITEGIKWKQEYEKISNETVTQRDVDLLSGKLDAVMIRLNSTEAASSNVYNFVQTISNSVYNLTLTVGITIAISVSLLSVAFIDFIFLNMGLTEKLVVNLRKIRNRKKQQG